MIKSKKDLHHYQYYDAVAMGLNPDSKFLMFKDYLKNPIWRFILNLRKVEYFLNTKNGIFGKICYYYHLYFLRKSGYALGFSIPPNVCQEGLSIPHYGTIVVNKNARIGRNCRIHICVNIGASFGPGAPKIGNNVYIGPGAKLFGDIILGDNLYIGANAAVNKSFVDGNYIIGGVPAKQLKQVQEPWWKRSNLKLSQ